MQGIVLSPATAQWLKDLRNSSQGESIGTAKGGSVRQVIHVLVTGDAYEDASGSGDPSNDCCTGAGQELADGRGVTVTILDGGQTGTHAMTWGGTYYSTGLFGTPEIELRAYCDGGGWTMERWRNGALQLSVSSTAASCDPFGVTFPPVTSGGSSDVTLTAGEPGATESGSQPRQRIPGVYFCTPTAYSPSAGQWTDYTEALCFEPNGHRLHTGTVYLAERYGIDEEGRWVFVTQHVDDSPEDDDASGSGSGDDPPTYTATITALTAVECVDGNIVGTSTTYTITSDSPISVSEG